MVGETGPKFDDRITPILQPSDREQRMRLKRCLEVQNCMDAIHEEMLRIEEAVSKARQVIVQGFARIGEKSPKQ